jgi:4-hydroxy-tetrahydrodipicolinate reductase
MKMIVHGCLGKLGSAICTMAAADAACEITAGVDVAGNSGGLTFPVYSDISLCGPTADVIIDCSVVKAVPAVLAYSVRHGIPLVVCTTGLSEELMAEIRATAEKVAVLQSPNMCMGINLLLNMVTRAAKVLADAKFDIEIVEKHHNRKVDAPSGTALLLADTVNQALDGRMKYVYDRHAQREKRGENEIGMHALRGGTIVGEHSVVFAGIDEVIEFKHQALSKEVFAAGVLSAARFIKGKPPGFYTMQDLIDAI